jgi:diadenosine tetraphosphate (Ap4A) HIT family hydrolase
VIWRGRHVAEPTELESGEAIAYWREVMQVGSAIQDQYQPAKMNYLTLGNAMPHLHTHIVPRPWDDPEAAGPFRFQLDPVESSEEELVKDAIALSERLKQDL